MWTLLRMLYTNYDKNNLVLRRTNVKHTKREEEAKMFSEMCHSTHLKLSREWRPRFGVDFNYYFVISKNNILFTTTISHMFILPMALNVLQIDVFVSIYLWNQ